MCCSRHDGAMGRFSLSPIELMSISNLEIVQIKLRRFASRSMLNSRARGIKRAGGQLALFLYLLNSGPSHALRCHVEQVPPGRTITTHLPRGNILKYIASCTYHDNFLSRYVVRSTYVRPSCTYCRNTIPQHSTTSILPVLLV
jgi:hypothetical protein